MKDEDYLWIMAFDDDPSYQALCMYLRQMGGFESNTDDAFRCPDGRTLPALILPKQVIELAKTMKIGRSRLKYTVFRKTVLTGKIEKWPRPPKPEKKRQMPHGPALPEGVITGKALLEKQSRRLRRSKASVEDPLPLPGGK